ncbi:hypothetical protein OROHE_007295 [Orobanche hederae]
MVRRKRGPGPSGQNKGKTRVEEPTDGVTVNKQNDQSMVEDDHMEKKATALVPRVLPHKSYCFTRTLSSNQVIPENSELFLKYSEARRLTDTSGSKILVAFDEDDRKYDLLFSRYVTWQFTHYSIAGDWETFVMVHRLKAGDEVSFYRSVDSSACDGCYYILKYVRKSQDGNDSESSRDDAGQQVEDKEKKEILWSPGSRSLPSSACCLSKTLTSPEVVRENPKLYFDPNDAIELTNFPEIVLFPPGTYSRDLTVFDGDDRQYMMRLSHDVSGSRETSYCVDKGWGVFLMAHDLKEGDRIEFYRFFEITVNVKDYYYVFKCFPEPNADKSLLRNIENETTRKLQCWMEKKAEVVDLLGKCKLVENKQRESADVEDDQNENKAQGLVARVLPRESYCFARTLSSNEVNPINSELFLEETEARKLTDTPGSKILVAFDEGNRKYNLLFSRYMTWQFVRYSITGDWETFIVVHNLKAGDEISFFRFSDSSVCDGYYYILNYVRNSSSSKDDDDDGRQVEDTKMSKVFWGPGSRPLPSSACCLSKTLTSGEVVRENSKLYFDSNDAIELTNFPEIILFPPGTFSKDLIVFDMEDRQYTMKLSHDMSGVRETSYCLNTGWSTFLVAHDLKEGHRIAFYRFFDTTVNAPDSYYVLKCFACPKADKSLQGVENEQEGPIAETRRKAELIALLGICELVENEHESGASTKGKDKVGVQTNEITEENRRKESSKVEDDENEKKTRGPVPRVLPCDVRCFSRTLSSNEVISISPELFLEDHESRFLTEFLGSEILQVYDEDSRIYNMLLSRYVMWECVQYSISVGWESFIRTHSLKAGDEVSLYKVLDRKVSDDYSYVLKYVRKSHNSEKPGEESGQRVEDKKMKNNVPGPGSRPLTSEFICLSKTLTSYEVVQDNPKLYFDPNDAITLTNSPEIERCPPRTYSKVLMVFDEDDRQYMMRLSHDNPGGGHGETSYSLNTGWGAYLRAHDLKEGDRLAFYRFPDESVVEDCYYVLVYFRKPAHIVDWVRKKPSEGVKVVAKVTESTEENMQNESSNIEDDEIEKKAPEPVPIIFRVLPCEVHCFTRTLNSNEVIPINPEIFLEDHEASFLTEFPGSKILGVIDEDGRIYNMLFSHYVMWECIQYSVSVGWDRFVATHSLKAGDEISLYRILDRNVSEDYSYILKYVRKSQNSEKSSDDKKMKIDEPGPGSRPLTSDFLCLSKTLTSYEVVQENPKLYFDPKDAITLTNAPEIEQCPPGTYPKELTVFDEDGRRYTMNLSHNNASEAYGETSYCLDTGWTAYLMAHDLKEGDRLEFYRFYDIRVGQDCYYVLVYFRKPALIVDWVKKKPRSADDDDHNESEPNKDCKSPDKHDSEKKSTELGTESGSSVPDAGACDFLSLLKRRLGAEIEEAERQIEYWEVKKSEAVDLLKSLG